MLVDIEDAKARFFELVEAARRGEDIVISVAGRPMARLMPPDPPSTPATFDGVPRHAEDVRRPGPPTPDPAPSR